MNLNITQVLVSIVVLMCIICIILCYIICILLLTVSEIHILKFFLVNMSHQCEMTFYICGSFYIYARFHISLFFVIFIDIFTLEGATKVLFVFLGPSLYVSHVLNIFFQFRRTAVCWSYFMPRGDSANIWMW